jgi:hypothetical protein
VIGYLDFNGMLAFLGGRSRAWGRLHVHEIPHRKLFDRLIFDPLELRAWVEQTAVRHNPVDVDAVVAEVMQPKKRRSAG